MEARSRPRPPAPVPQAGALPLPADIPRERLEFALASVEDLNGIVPEGVPRLATPLGHPNVRVHSWGNSLEPTVAWS